MEFTFDKAEHTFNFKFQDDVLHIDVTEGGKVWKGSVESLPFIGLSREPPTYDIKPHIAIELTSEEVYWTFLSYNDGELSEDTDIKFIRDLDDDTVELLVSMDNMSAIPIVLELC